MRVSTAIRLSGASRPPGEPPGVADGLASPSSATTSCSVGRGRVSARRAAGPRAGGGEVYAGIGEFFERFGSEVVSVVGQVKARRSDFRPSRLGRR
jgi:hypothetical protein